VNKGKHSLGHGWHGYHDHLRREASAKVGDGEGRGGGCIKSIALSWICSASWLLRGCRIRYGHWAAGARVMHGFWGHQILELKPLLLFDNIPTSSQH
jgi:hypothetical protein